jgi:glutamine synthetase
MFAQKLSFKNKYNKKITMNMKITLEYIWLDGNNPQQLRSKTKIVDHKVGDGGSDPSRYPIWSFDGSSTNQASSGKGKNTDCLLKPVYMTQDPFRTDMVSRTYNKLILCEVLNPDGTTHATNNRQNLFEKIKNLGITENSPINELPWFGWEQEYTLTHKSDNPFDKGVGLPLGFTLNKSPRPQGDYYCGIGSDSVIGREIVEEHMKICLEIGLEISGINAEVLLGQWEYQIGPVLALNGSDQMWMSRYLLQRIAEKHNVNVCLHPKPIKGDWNGTGCHVNFSTKEMRSDGGIDIIENVMNKLEKNHNNHIKVYGLHNEERLTGAHETSGINDFSFGYSTRDTSVRIPAQTIMDKKGYFEDRRPSSNCDPYLVANQMLETIYSNIEDIEESEHPTSYHDDLPF